MAVGDSRLRLSVRAKVKIRVRQHCTLASLKDASFRDNLSSCL